MIQRLQGTLVAPASRTQGAVIMLPYALYHCCRKPRGASFQRDRDRARVLLLLVACAFYLSAVGVYL
jgi:hypothetical protein